MAEEPVVATTAYGTEPSCSAQTSAAVRHCSPVIGLLFKVATTASSLPGDQRDRPGIEPARTARRSPRLRGPRSSRRPPCYRTLWTASGAAKASELGCHLRGTGGTRLWRDNRSRSRRRSRLSSRRYSRRPQKCSRRGTRPSASSHWTRGHHRRRCGWRGSLRRPSRCLANPVVRPAQHDRVKCPNTDWGAVGDVDAREHVSA